MERRDFIRLSAVGVGAGIVAPTTVLANSENQVKGSSDIYYTKEDPGRWSGSRRVLPQRRGRWVR